MKLSSTWSRWVYFCAMVIDCNIKDRLNFLLASFPDSVRLNNGTERCSGRVEIFQGGQWGKICNSNWGHKEASLVCHELQCGMPKKFQESFNFGDSGLTGYTSRCSGNVSSISQCELEKSGMCAGVSLSCEGKKVDTCCRNSPLACSFYLYNFCISLFFRK